MRIRSTTIIAVRKNGKVALAGDGQVTLGENTAISMGQTKYEHCQMEVFLRGLQVLPETP